jgi:predicted cytidylate kinase
VIVTVGGLPGTGTSTLCGILERELGLPYVYAGQIFRQEAASRGLSLGELNELAQSDKSVDLELDRRQVELLRTGNVILEGRMAGWLSYRYELAALRVWVVCDEEERIRRLVERDGGDPETQRVATAERVAQEQDRYRRYYDADVNDSSIYDLILDSTSRTPADLAAEVLGAVRGQV